MDNTSNNSGEAQVADQNPQAQVATSTTPVVNEQQSSIPEAFRDEFEKLRRENRNLRKRFEEQDNAAKVAEEQRLHEQGEFKKLAEKHEARVRELEPVADRYTQLSELVASQIQAQIKNWPAEVKAFDPGDDAPIEQRLTWMEKGKALVEKLQQQARSSQPGNAPNPRPMSQPSAEGTQLTYEQRLRASGKYGI